MTDKTEKYIKFLSKGYIYILVELISHVKMSYQSVTFELHGE